MTDKKAIATIFKDGDNIGIELIEGVQQFELYGFLKIYIEQLNDDLKDLLKGVNIG